MVIVTPNPRLVTVLWSCEETKNLQILSKGMIDSIVSWCHHDMKMVLTLLALHEGKDDGGFFPQRNPWCGTLMFACCWSRITVEQTVELMWDPVKPMSAPSHYLSQCWLFSKAWWHSSHGNITKGYVSHQTLKLVVKFPIQNFIHISQGLMS